MDTTTLKLIASLKDAVARVMEAIRSAKDKRALARARKEREQELAEEKARQQRREPPKIASPPKLPEVSKKAAQEKQQALFADAPAQGEKPALGLLDAPDTNRKKRFLPGIPGKACPACWS